MSWLDAGYAHLKRDPLMAGLIERYQPTPLEKSQDLFKYIAGNIIYQQISTAAGNAIEKKFIDELRCRNGNLNITCGRMPTAAGEL